MESIHKKIIRQLAENALIQKGNNPTLAPYTPEPTPYTPEPTPSDTSALQSSGEITLIPQTDYLALDTFSKPSHQDIVNKYLNLKPPTHTPQGLLDQEPPNSLPGDSKSCIETQYTATLGNGVGDNVKTLSELRADIRQGSGGGKGRGRGCEGWVESNRDFEAAVEKKLRSPVRTESKFDKGNIEEYLRREKKI